MSSLNFRPFCLIIYFYLFQLVDHDHAADEAVISAGKVFNAMKDTIKEDPTLPIKRAYNRTIHQRLDDEEDEELPDFSRLRTRLQRVRASMLPPLPHDIHDVVIQNEWTETWAGNDFLSLLDNDWGIAVFATRANFRTLGRCETIYIDGTFKTCPEPYTQFVTIHGKYQGQVFTLCMCLLTGRTVGHYRQLLQHVKERIRNATGHRLRPTRVICDFENALMIALETELVNTQICGCYFHFCQSLWRKIQELGLARAYIRRRRVRQLLRKIMALGHLPVAIVRQNFFVLANERRTRRLIDRYPAIRDFLLYIQNSYIEGTFPVILWNVYRRDGDCRTNNIVEGKAINLSPFSIIC